MRKSFFYIIILAFILPGCAIKPGSTQKVVKPKYHHRWYDRKKDKKAKRTKVVRMRN